MPSVANNVGWPRLIHSSRPNGMTDECIFGAVAANSAAAAAAAATALSGVHRRCLLPTTFVTDEAQPLEASPMFVRPKPTKSTPFRKFIRRTESSPNDL